MPARIRIFSLMRASPLVLILMGPAAMGQPPVPPEYADLYAFLGGKLDAFDRSIPPADGPFPVTFATELLSANGNRGRALLGPNALAGIRLELDRLRALNVKAVTVAIPFPILDDSFLAFNGDPGDRQPLIDFFARVVTETHARGMKLLVENGVMFGGVYAAGSGMDAAAYYPTLTDDQLVAGRAAQVVTIASQIAPDLLNVGSEPDTEAHLTGHPFLETPAGFAGMVRTFLAQLGGAGLTSVPVVAGSGTWLYRADAFVAELCRIPALWGIDLHLYPVNLDFADRAIALAAQARAAGKHVTMLECWLQKERDSELATLEPAFDATLFARDSFGFWEPLDRGFLSVMVRYAVSAKVEFLSPFWSRYFLAYLDYDSVMAASPAPTTDQIVAMATAAHAEALTSGRTTGTGRLWASLIGGTPGVPTVTKIVPVVLDVAGRGGSRFTTELTLANRGTTTAAVRLDYTPAASLGASGGGAVSLSLAPGLQRVVPDAVAFLRDGGLAIPAGPGQGGAVRVTFSGLSSPDVAYAGARTTTPSGSGRAGLAYAAVDATAATAATSFVYGLRSTSGDRSNLALVNADTGGPVTLRVTLYSGADGRSFTRSPDTTLQPGEWTQMGNVLAPSGFPNGWARVDVVAGVGPYLAYGVFNDNVTDDGSFVASELAALPAEPRIVPVVVESPTFESELVLTNPTRFPTTVTLSYVESLSPGGGPGGSVTLSLQPGEQRILPGVLDVLRQEGIAIGPKGSAPFAGALTVSFGNGGSASPGFAGARTAAPPAGGGPGEYGLFASGPGVSFGAADEAWVFDLRQDAACRSNLAVVNAGDAGDVLLVRVDVFDGDTGRPAGSVGPMALAPLGWKQLNALLSPLGVSNGYARVTRTSGSGRFLAYGVVNDGATAASGATNDGSYVAMSGE